MSVVPKQKLKAVSLEKLSKSKADEAEVASVKQAAAKKDVAQIVKLLNDEVQH